jgi:hypothetical protein
VILIEKSWSQTLSNNGALISILAASEISGGSGDFVNTSGTLTNHGIVSFSGNYANGGIFNGNGTYNVGGIFLNTGTFNGDTSTFNYNGAGAQIVLALNYSTLNLSNSGIKTFASGTTGITDSLNISGAMGDAITNSSTINYNGNGNQNVAPLSYYNLTCSNNGTKLAVGDILLNNLFTLSETASFDADGIANDKKFTLKSDSIGTASIGFLATPTNFTGNITMQRYIDAGETSWRFLTAATAGMTLAQFSGDFITSGFTGSDYPDYPTAANPFTSIYYYDETVAGDVDNGFVPATDTTNSVTVGEGVWVWSGDASSGTKPFLVDMEGPANTGTINLPLNYTNSGSSTDDGWNMVGNPYPSSIDWNTGITRVAVDDAIYIWNPDLGQYASYVNGISTNGGSNKIASSQAFWVHATSALKSVQVTEGSKITEDAPFLKQSPTYLTIEAINAYGRDEAIVNFNANAAIGFSGSYDAYKIESVETYRPSVSTLIDNGSELSINQMPDHGVSIPLKVTSASAGMNQINFLGLPNFTNSSCILLEDLFTDSIYDLTTMNSITVYIYDTTTTARFLIKFGAEITTLISDLSCYGLTDGAIVITKNSPTPYDVIWKDEQNNILSTQTNVIGSDSIDNIIPGSYFIETIDNVCGNLYDSAVVAGPLQIVANYTTQSDTIYLVEGGILSLTNQSSNATYYDWDFGDLNYSTQVNPSHKYSQGGIYNLSLTAFQSPLCSKTIYRDITVVDITTSITKSADQGNVNVWITSNHLNITSINSFDKVEIRNVLGQEIFNKNKSQSSITFNLSSLSSQILLVRTFRNDVVYSFKIIYVKN